MTFIVDMRNHFKRKKTLNNSKISSNNSKLKNAYASSKQKLKPMAQVAGSYWDAGTSFASGVLTSKKGILYLQRYSPVAGGVLKRVNPYMNFIGVASSIYPRKKSKERVIRNLCFQGAGIILTTHLGPLAILAAGPGIYADIKRRKRAKLKKSENKNNSEKLEDTLE